MPIRVVKKRETLWGIAEELKIPEKERTPELWKKWGYTGAPEKMPVGFELNVSETTPSLASYLKGEGIYKPVPGSLAEAAEKEKVVSPVDRGTPPPGYPSWEWYDAEQKVKEAGLVATTENIRKAMAGESLEEKIIIEETKDLLGTSEEAREEEVTEEEKEEEKNAKDIKDQENQIVQLTNAQRIANLKKDLAGLGFDFDIETGDITEKPALPTYADDFDALRDEHGMEAIETQINNLSTEMRDIDASLRLGLAKQKERLAPVGMITTEQQKLKRQAQEDLDYLNRRKQTLVDEYNTKAGIINSTMTLKQMDYAAAKDSYNTSFNQAITLLDYIEGKVTKEQQEENRERDDARANLSIITNLIKDRKWGDVSADIKTQITSLETKAGMPAGIIEAFMEAQPGLTVDYTATGTDAAGNTIVSFFSYNNGDPKLIKTIQTGAIAKPTPEAKKIADWDNARAFITDNPDATYDQLYNGISQYTDLSPSDVEQVLKEAGVTEEEFLTKEYFRGMYTDAQIRAAIEETFTIDEQSKMARDAGFGKWRWTKGAEIDAYLKSEKSVDDYLNYLEGLVGQYRKGGYTDKEIWKMFPKK